MIAGKSSISSAGRATVLATVAALALSAVAPSTVMAAQTGKAETGKAEAGKAVSAASSDATDFSARRRVAVRRGGGGAAAAAAFAGIVGTGLAIAATQNRRAYYDDYYGAPYYQGGYGPGYGYYYSPGW
jgi:hypothetical protein